MFKLQGFKTRVIMTFSIMVVVGMLAIPTGVLAGTSATATTMTTTVVGTRTTTTTVDQDASNKAKVSQDNAQTGTTTGGKIDQDASNKAKVKQ
jgi:hypothetical protein